ncbi:MAG: tRNA pseudouridine(55) synthase TruB, partial [Pseudomonadota bacterium]
MDKAACSGWLILDKPQGLQCTKLVGQIKRMFGTKKAGHAGTLDPFATGLLPVALGEATKIMPYIAGSDKRYAFTMRFGYETDTLDCDGQITAQSDERPSLAAIEAILPHFLGRISQIPPKYSAVHIDGKRAYDLARKGEDFTMPAREVVIHDLTVQDHPDRDHMILMVHCGTGTYVRSLARDIAYYAGAYTTLSALRRTTFGQLQENDAISLGKLEKKAHKGAQSSMLQPTGYVLDGIPVCQVSCSQCALIRQGRGIRIEDCQVSPAMKPRDQQIVAIYKEADLLAMAKGN